VYDLETGAAADEQRVIIGGGKLGGERETSDYFVDRVVSAHVFSREQDFAASVH
jgi:hypothetical protein